MSLAEKLKQKSQELEQEKAATHQDIQEKELEPVRARIAEIEKNKHRLLILKNSLSLRSDAKTETGIGMQEYSAETKSNVQKESKRLDTLMSEHSEVLKGMGVENREQLAANEEFAAEPEVVSYKGALKEQENISSAHAAFKNRLAELWLPPESSYEVAEKMIGEKILALDQELMQEKMKTPEGKEAAIEMLSRKLEGEIPEMAFSKEKKSDGYTFSLSMSHRNANITIADPASSGKFNNLREVRLVPSDLTELEQKYGVEISGEAVRKAYAHKIDQAFESFDKENERANDILRGLESADPKKAEVARAAFADFSRNSGKEFYEAAKSKIEELEKKGLSVRSARGTYEGIEDMSRLSQYGDHNKTIEEAINNPDAFPPIFDWNALAQKIERRNAQNKELMDVISKIQTQEDLDRFSTWEPGGSKPREEGSMGKIYQDLLKENTFLGIDDRMKGKDDINPAFRFTGEGGYKTLEALSKKFSSYSEAVRYLKEKQKEQETMKEKVKKVLNPVVDLRLKESELISVAKTEHFVDRLQYIDTEISQVEKDKNDAYDLMSTLAKIEVELPHGENLVLERGQITVLSISEALAQLKKDIEQEKNNLKEIDQKINNYPKKPLFGKEKWQTALDELTSEKKTLEAKLDKSNEEYRALNNKHYVQVKGIPQSSKVSSLLEKQKSTGTAENIFDALKEELKKEVIDRKVPETIIRLNNERKALEGQIT